MDIWEALEAMPPAQRAGLRDLVPLSQITREERLLQVLIKDFTKRQDRNCVLRQRAGEILGMVWQPV